MTARGVALGREQAEPSRHVEPGHAGFVRGRDVRDRAGALRRHVDDRLDGAGADLRQRHRALRDQKVDLAGDQIGHGRAGAAIGNEKYFGVGELLQQQPAHLRRRILVDELGVAGILLHPGDQRFEIVRRQRLLGDQKLRIVRDQPDRLEIGLQIVIEIVDDAADMGVPLADVDGVAVGRGAREPPDADRAAGAADILDDDRLAEERSHPVGDDAPGHVGRAARRERHDQGDRAGGKVLRVNGSNGGNKRQRECNDKFLQVTFLPAID